jgi:hypothetical protein
MPVPQRELLRRLLAEKSLTQWDRRVHSADAVTAWARQVEIAWSKHRSSPSRNSPTTQGSDTLSGGDALGVTGGGDTLGVTSGGIPEVDGA